jgi:hypothetical protein
MTRVFRPIWAVLIALFVVLIPIQFYLAGHGAMEGAHAADKNILPMTSAWDPHTALGTIMLLVSLLILLAALGASLERRLLGMSAGLFVFMVIQFLLPLLNDSAAGRAVAALHAVNALVVTGIAIGLLMRVRRIYMPVGRRVEAERSQVGL